MDFNNGVNVSSSQHLETRGKENEDPEMSMQQQRMRKHASLEQLHTFVIPEPSSKKLRVINRGAVAQRNQPRSESGQHPVIINAPVQSLIMNNYGSVAPCLQCPLLAAQLEMREQQQQEMQEELAIKDAVLEPSSNESGPIHERFKVLQRNLGDARKVIEKNNNSITQLNMQVNQHEIDKARCAAKLRDAERGHEREIAALLERLSVSESKQTPPRQFSKEQSDVINSIAIIARDMTDFIEDTAMCNSPDRRNDMVQTFRCATKDLERHGVTVGLSSSIESSRKQNSGEETTLCETNRSSVELFHQHCKGEVLTVSDYTKLILTMKEKGKDLQQQRDKALQKVERLQQELIEARFTTIPGTPSPPPKRRGISSNQNLEICKIQPFQFPPYSTLGCGMVNYGNTCFLNAVMQGLVEIPRFESFVAAACICNKSADRSAPKCVFCIADQVLKLLKGRKVVKAKSFVDLILPAAMGKNFVSGKQQDAGECFSGFIKVLREEAADASDVEAIFWQQTQIVRTCETCQHAQKYVIDKSMMLQVPIEGVTTLAQGIMQQMEFYELLTDFECSICSGIGSNLEKREAKETSMFVTLPPVLIVNLGRIHVDRQDFIKPASNSKESTFKLSKLHNPVDVPQELLLKKADTSTVMYKLHSAVCHIGEEASSGHYVGCRRTSADSFALFDDDKCPQLLSIDELSQFLRRTACLVVYQKVEGVTTREAATSTHEQCFENNGMQKECNSTEVDPLQPRNNITSGDKNTTIDAASNAAVTQEGSVQEAALLGDMIVRNEGGSAEESIEVLLSNQYTHRRSPIAPYSEAEEAAEESQGESIDFSFL